MWPQLIAAARRDLWERSAAAARAAQLGATPCPLETVLQMALYLGIDPCTHAHLLWMAHVALTPPMPPGWVRCEGREDFEPYYVHPAAGYAQWEHPHVSFLAGLARRLVEVEIDNDAPKV